MPVLVAGCSQERNSGCTETMHYSGTSKRVLPPCFQELVVEHRLTIGQVTGIL